MRAPQVPRIFFNAPEWVNANGPRSKEHPSGFVTRMEANSLSNAWKCGPRSPIWLRAKGTNLIVEEEEIGFTDLRSFPNLTRSAPLRTKSELLEEEDKHDFVRAEAITKSIAVSNLWTSLPRAKMSPGRDLSRRR
jgi:hypothetical protein